MKEKPQQKRKAAEHKPRTGSLDKALVDYEKAMKLFHKRQWEEAKEAFQAVLDKHSAELDVIERAQMYLRIAEDQIAPKKPRPRSAEDHYLLATLEHNAGEYRAAVTEIEKALEMSPHEDRFHYALAASLARLGQEKESLRALKTAIEKNRENALAAARDEDFDILDAHPDFLELTRLDSPGSQD